MPHTDVPQHLIVVNTFYRLVADATNLFLDSLGKSCRQNVSVVSQGVVGQQVVAVKKLFLTLVDVTLGRWLSFYIFGDVSIVVARANPLRRVNLLHLTYCPAILALPAGGF